MSAQAVCVRSGFIFWRAGPLCFRALLLAWAFAGFSAGAFAVTLGETATAAAIAGTLQGTASSQPQKAIQKAKQAVQQYEVAQQKQLDGLQPAVADTVSSPSIDSTNASPLEDPASPPDRAPAFQGAWFSQNGGNVSEASLPHDGSHLRNMTREELEDELGDQSIQDEIEPVDYGRSVQIFYKNKCPRSAGNCDRGAVFTNIKSVIFDYARARAGLPRRK